MENKHCFYVLKCSDNTFYAGYTNNLEKRIATHNAKKGAKYTKTRTPVECVYVEQFDTKQEAMRQEYAFKQLTRAQKIQYMRSNSHDSKSEK
ncbi:MAG: GIY-YIG nuclease family protein [Lysinibacillus sp.]